MRLCYVVGHEGRRKSWKALCTLIAFAWLSGSSIAAEPGASQATSATASQASTMAQSVSQSSAKGAAVERSNIYRAGAAYSKWLDRVAENSGNAFLQRQILYRITWMRLLGTASALVVLSLVAGAFVWIVRRHAGEIQSKRHQSWLALSATAIRKPFALFLLVCGGAFALMPIVTGIVSRPTRLFLAGALTDIFYAGWIIALLWLVFRVIRALAKRMHLWAKRTGSLLGKVIVPVLEQALQLAVPLLGIILLLPVLKLPEGWTWVTEEALGIFLIVALSTLIVRGINAVQEALLSRHRIDVPDNSSARRIHTQVSVIRKVIVTAVVIIATGSILMLFAPVRQFGTSILASAGIAGVVIGFAAQKTLGNVLAGIQIALTQLLLIDDIVVVEGEFGQIEEITLTYVTVRTWDLRRMILPITYFVERPFQNWSRVSPEVLGTVILYLDYQAPLGELRAELKRLVENNPKWDRKVCGLQVTDTKQTAVEVRALVSSTDPGKAFDLRCEVREGLIQFLRRHHPESLPRVRNVIEPRDEEIRRTKSKDGAAAQGKEQERPSKSPGVHVDARTDGSHS